MEAVVGVAGDGQGLVVPGGPRFVWETARLRHFQEWWRVGSVHPATITVQIQQKYKTNTTEIQNKYNRYTKQIQ